MAAILVPADMPRLLAALDELSNFPDEDVRQSVVIMLAGLTGLLSQKSCTEMLLPRIMRLLQDTAYLVRKVSPTHQLGISGGCTSYVAGWDLHAGVLHVEAAQQHDNAVAGHEEERFLSRLSSSHEVVKTY